MKNSPFIIERTFNAPITRVWKAITSAADMKHWYFDIAEFRPTVGFEFEFSAGEGDKHHLHRCKVIEVVDGKKITYSWQYPGYEGVSYVTFELTAIGNKTKLTLTHAGLETFPANNPDFAPESFAAGWTHILDNSLKGFIEKP